jgi:hypothetical protein
MGFVQYTLAANMTIEHHAFEQSFRPENGFVENLAQFATSDGIGSPDPLALFKTGSCPPERRNSLHL